MVIELTTGSGTKIFAPLKQIQSRFLRNEGEAEVAVAACVALLKGKCKAREIAIITPYKAQQHEIRSRLQCEIGSNAGSILVGTVHALQGCERECIIISFVRSFAEEGQDIASFDAAGDSQALQELRQQSLGILQNSKLLNVAITRAKYGLVAIGNADVLSNGPKDLHDFMDSLSPLLHFHVSAVVRYR